MARRLHALAELKAATLTHCECRYRRLSGISTC